MNILDWVLIGIGILGLIRGLWRGAVTQVFGIIGVLGGFLLAAHHYQTVSVQLARGFPKLPGTAAISFAVIFLLTWLCVGLLGFLTAKILHRGGLGFLDRLLGAVVGLGKAGVTGVILISILTLFISPRNPVITQSILAPQVQNFAHLLVQAAPESIRTLFEQKSKELQQYWLEHRKDLEKTVVAEKTEKREKKSSDDKRSK